MITIGIFHWICLILPGLDHWFVPEKRIAWNRKTTVNWSPSWGCSYSRASHGGGDSAECLVEDVLVVVVVVMMLYITMPVVVPHAMMLIILGKWSRLFSLTPCSPWPPYHHHQDDYHHGMRHHDRYLVMYTIMTTTTTTSTTSTSKHYQVASLIILINFTLAGLALLDITLKVTQQQFHENFAMKEAKRQSRF